MTDKEKERSAYDEYRAPKMREVRFTAQEARDAINEIIESAKKTGNRAPELVAVVLQCIIQTQETIARDLEYIRARLDLIEKQLQSHSRR
jgi:polyhydroxyalkanoate synthesis regulator phasin